MSKTVVGLFDDFSQAQNAVHDLEGLGIAHNDISLVANNADGQHDQYVATSADHTVHAAGGAGAGAVTGTVVGGGLGLLAGIGLLAIPGFGPVVAAGWLISTITGAGIGAAAGGLLGALVGAGVPHEEAHLYNEGVRRGGTLIAVKTSDDTAAEAADILGRYGAVNIDERADAYNQPYDETASSKRMPTPANAVVPLSTSTTPQYDVTPTTTQTDFINTQSTGPVPVARTLNENEVALPVVQEELQVGKREVQRGGVRVYSHITETPVEESIRLHEEHINVERRSVDRPLTAADSVAFKEENFELRETAEEAVINKQARVVEEVVVGKTATDRTETVHDTVRRTDVEVEQLGTQHMARNADPDSYESDFRSNYDQTYASTGMAYDQYAPAYRYGYGLNNDARYRGRDWNSVQSDVQRDWESRQPGTWGHFSNAIRYAWDKATGSARGGVKTGGQSLDGSPDTRGITEKVADTMTGDRIDDKTGKTVV